MFSPSTIFFVGLSLAWVACDTLVTNFTVKPTITQIVQLGLIKPSKYLYTSNDRWLNIQCKKWSNAQPEEFYFEQNQQKTLIFDSRTNQVCDPFQDNFKINQAQDG